MRRVVIIIPEWLGKSEDESIFRQKFPYLKKFAEFGTIGKITETPVVETPEALYLGLNHREAQLRQGPLTIAALGADPPSPSSHFHVSLLSYEDGRASQINLEPSPEEVVAISEAAKRLNTRTLTFVKGEALDHGLVWEGNGEHMTKAPRGWNREPLKSHLPEGDAEKALRRYIDDSVNLLSELEVNEIRLEEGLPPLNLLWPWGVGNRLEVPNLFLRRGERAHVESNSLRLAGLTRLVGYRHGNRSEFGRGTSTRFEALAQKLMKESASITVIDAFQDLRPKGQVEEMEWISREIDRELIRPLLEQNLREQRLLTLVAPGSDLGLGLRLAGKPNIEESNFPIDERSREERSIQTFDLPAWVDYGLQVSLP